jgi:hypothetical protein
MMRIVASMAAMAFVCGRAGLAEAASGANGLAVLDSVLDQIRPVDPESRATKSSQVEVLPEGD